MGWGEGLGGWVDEGMWDGGMMGWGGEDVGMGIVGIRAGWGGWGYVVWEMVDVGYGMGDVGCGNRAGVVRGDVGTHSILEHGDVEQYYMIC